MQNPGIGSSATITGTVNSKTPLTALTPTFATVGLTSSLVLSANANRKSVVFVNTSSNNISFGIGTNDAVLYSGITLVPNGVWESDEYSYITSAINAIASGALSNLSIQEFI